MEIRLTPEDCARLSPDLLSQLITQLIAHPRPADAAAGSTPAPAPEAPDASGIDYEGVIDLTPRQVTAFMRGCQQPTKDGLRVFAEHGPEIDAKLLHSVGITDCSRFQGNLTKRTRTVTGIPGAFLLGWDHDWQYAAGKVVSGRYGVTQTTFASLRKYFRLDD
jgi:hypothetical protein